MKNPITLSCPWCGSLDLLTLQETKCCEECGGSFQVVQEPQDELIDDAIEKMKKTPAIRRFAEENGIEIKELKIPKDFLHNDFIGLSSWDKKENDPDTMFDKLGSDTLQRCLKASEFTATIKDFYDFLNTKLPYEKLNSGETIKVPFIGIGLENYIEKTFKDFGYETLIIIRGSEYNDYSCFESPKGKTLVVINEFDRMPSEDFKKVINELNKMNEVKYALFYLNSEYGYEKMKG